MMLILIGDKTSTLTALIPESDKIETVILSRSLDALDPYAQGPDPRYGLIIIDLSSCKSLHQILFDKLRTKFPSHEIWAFYMFRNPVVSEHLEKIGFQKVLSMVDDIPSMICHFFEAT